MDSFDDFFPDGIKSLQTGFVVSPRWRAEITKWLDCVYGVDPKYCERAKNRAKQDTFKQAEVLAEIRSMYFLHERGRAISALEPDRVDVTFTDTNGAEWNAEVKCPSYGQEIFERDIPRADKLARKQRPKYINEGGSFDFKRQYVDPIEKSVSKFEEGSNNLLIISDNLFVSLVEDPSLEENVKTALRGSDPQGKISAVLLLHVQLGNAFEYVARMAEITKPLALREAEK